MHVQTVCFSIWTFVTDSLVHIHQEETKLAVNGNENYKCKRVFRLFISSFIWWTWTSKRLSLGEEASNKLAFTRTFFINSFTYIRSKIAAKVWTGSNNSVHEIMVIEFPKWVFPFAVNIMVSFVFYTEFTRQKLFLDDEGIYNFTSILKCCDQW
jgi:hypothetical protein